MLHREERLEEEAASNSNWMRPQIAHPTVWIARIVLSAIMVVASVNPAVSQSVFLDKTADLGLEITNGAACWADFNNDGWVDVCAGGIWLNNEGKSFTKIGDAGSAVAADFDNDGFTDLFSWSSLRVLRNEDGKKFTAIELPELPKCSSRGACWGDFNEDGFVDLFVGGYEDWGNNITFPFLVLINEGGKSFRLDRAESKYRARGVAACDFDQDGDLDVYVSNYRLQPNVLWQNDSKGKFTDVAGSLGALATSPGFGGGHSIGSAWGDFNNDGLLDIFAGNFAHRDGRGDQPKSRFLQNLGKEQGYKFQDLGPRGVFYQESYATPSTGDYDNDGNLDLFFTTVYGVASFGKKNSPVLYKNDGSATVTDVTVASKLPSLPPTYQAAWADYDNDGDLDLTSGGRLFQNQGNKNSWLKVRLFGDSKNVNRSAIGAQVRIKLGDKTLTRQVAAGTGEGNQDELTLHFGLGSHVDPVDIHMLWPGGIVQTVKAVKPRQTRTVQFALVP